MSNILHSLNPARSGGVSWALFSLLISAIIILPLIILGVNFMEPPGEIWDNLAKTLLWEYISNTLILIFGVGGITVLMGVVTAWMVTMFHFPGRKLFEWLLIMPLAVPPYIAASTYSGIFDFTGPLQTFLRSFLGEQQALTYYIDIMHIQYLIIILGLVMYPYVYLICRAAFMRQSGSALEAGRMLGLSSTRVFYKIALPLIRPAIIGGVSIVVMELLNDYGAMKYFGVGTFATGICNVWLSYGDINAAIRLSGMLMLIVLIILILERTLRGKRKFDDSGSRFRPVSKVRLKGIKQLGPVLICLIPVLLGFIFPVLQLISWASQTVGEVINEEFIAMILNSLKLAGGAAISTVILSMIVIYALRLNKTRSLKFTSKLATIGYSIPGTVIAMGILIPFMFIHNYLAENDPGYDLMSGLAMGTVIALSFAYVVRFLALPANSIDAGFEKIAGNVDEASRLLGASPTRTLFRINIPLLRGAILAGAILVFVDVLKELPITIVLRPFNFDTLAIKAFELAKNEMIREASVPSLILIITGMIPILFLNRLLK